MIQGLLPGSQGQNVALTALYVPSSIESGGWQRFASAEAWHEAGPPNHHDDIVDLDQ